MNVKLAYIVVYGVFAPYLAGGYGILDFQRNSTCDPCPSPSLISSLISTLNPRQTRIRWKKSCETRNLISLTHFLMDNSSLANLISSFATLFPPDSGLAGIQGGDKRGDEGRGRTWITGGIPLEIQNSVATSQIRSKNSVNDYICQFHIHLLQYVIHLQC